MRVLVTRPGADGAALAEALTDRGIESLHEPLFTVQNLDGPELNISDIKAILVTSANGVRALAERTSVRDIPIYAVGDATGTASRDAGFVQVHSASGDVEDLATLVIDMLDPKDGPLLHVAGSLVAGDLGGSLKSAGFICRREVLYEIHEAKSLSPTAVAALKDGGIGAVLLYSPRTAETFMQLIRKSRLVRACKDVAVICLSKAVAERINDLTWKAVLVADQPTQDSLLDVLSDYGGIEAGGSNSRSAQSKPADVPEPHIVAPIQRRQGAALRTVFLTLFAVVLIAGTGLATQPLWYPQLVQIFPALNKEQEREAQLRDLAGRLNVLETRSTEDVPRLEELQAERFRIQSKLERSLERIDSLEKSINSVRQMIAAVDTNNGPAVAQDTLRKLSERLARLETGNSNEQSDKKLGDLEARLTELAKRSLADGKSNSSGRAQAFMLAVGQLRQAVTSSRPFLSELAALGALAEDKTSLRNSLSALDPYAAKGIPGLNQLRSEFSSLAGTIVQVDKMPQGDGWIDRTIARLSTSLKWRRTDNVAGAGVEAVVARAEHLLKNADLPGSLNELKALTGRPATIAAPWIENANALLTAQNILAELQVTAVSMLTGNE